MAKFVKCCRIRIASKTIPNSRRTGFGSFAAGLWSYLSGHKMAQEPEAVGDGGWVPKPGRGVLTRLYGTAALCGATRLSGIIAKGRTALTALVTTALRPLTPNCLPIDEH